MSYMQFSKLISFLGSALSGGADRPVQSKLLDVVNIRDFGAVGDGVTDDSLAFNNAIAYANSIGKSLYFSNGNYKIASPNTISVRSSLVGDGDATIIGNLVFSAIFPPSADIATSLQGTEPFFRFINLNFKTTSTTNYALTVTSQIQGMFIDTMEMRGCKFYGTLGFQGNSLASVNMDGCWFYSRLIGVQANSCTNVQVNGCRWRNQVQYGYMAGTRAGDSRLGGESHRFVNCEWAVCATAVYLQANNWSIFDNCLMDYCTLPLNFAGSDYVKLTNTYLGAANQASLSNDPNYISPPSIGIAVYGHNYTPPGGSQLVSGVSATNCEFVSYVTGSNQPIVYVAGVPGGPANRVSLSQCKFLASTTHSMPTLLAISYAQMVSLMDNEFISYNQSTSLTAPYSISNVNVWQAVGSQVLNCTQNNVTVLAPSEQIQTSVIQMSNGGEGIGFADASGNIVMSLQNSGNGRVNLYTGGQLRNVGVGPADSAGAGYRLLIVPN